MKKLTLFTCILFSASTWAGGLNIKPGLWEIQNQMNVNGKPMPDMSQHAAEMQKHMAEMKAHMAEMPPAMQERMKAALSQNNQMGMTDKGLTVCMTQDQIDRSEMAHDPNSHCKTVDMQHSGDVTTMKMHCDAPHASDMTTAVTRISDSEWKSTTHMTAGDRTIDSSGHGKWLKADCGDVKPLGQTNPAKKI